MKLKPYFSDNHFETGVACDKCETFIRFASSWDMLISNSNDMNYCKECGREDERV